MNKPEFFKINSQINLRRLVFSNPKAKATVLFLHGFPETLLAWKEIAQALAQKYEVHAFDWPGFGLSTRPPVGEFSYSSRDYAGILKDYVTGSGLDTSKLLIYATDIGALPALMMAIESPELVEKMIVGDFAPFDRPQYMWESLQALKVTASADPVRAFMNKNRDEILANTFFRGLSEDEKFQVSREFQGDMFESWSQSDISVVDAFAHYYSHFTRDQNEFESKLAQLKTPLRVIWGEKDIYIKKEMGAEFALKTNTELKVFPGIGHFPHLQNPKHSVDEIHSFID